MEETGNQLLTLDEVLADWLPVSRSTLYAEIRSGRLRVTKLGRRSFVCISDIKEYISELRGQSS